MDTAHSSQDAAPPRTISLRAPSPLSIQASSTPGDLNTAPIGFVNYKCTSTRASASGTEVPGADMSATGVSAASPSTSSPAPTGGQPMQIHEAHVGPKQCTPAAVPPRPIQQSLAWPPSPIEGLVSLSLFNDLFIESPQSPAFPPHSIFPPPTSAALAAPAAEPPLVLFAVPASVQRHATPAAAPATVPAAAPAAAPTDTEAPAPAPTSVPVPPSLAAPPAASVPEQIAGRASTAMPNAQTAAATVPLPEVLTETDAAVAKGAVTATTTPLPPTGYSSRLRSKATAVTDAPKHESVAPLSSSIRKVALPSPVRRSSRYTPAVGIPAVSVPS